MRYAASLSTEWIILRQGRGHSKRASALTAQVSLCFRQCPQFRERLTSAISAMFEGEPQPVLRPDETAFFKIAISKFKCCNR
jgi:hypothetical protein